MSSFGVGGGNWLQNQTAGTGINPQVAEATDSLSDYEEQIRTTPIPIGTPDNSKTQQVAPIDPSSGGLLLLETEKMDSYGATTLKNLNGDNIDKTNDPTLIGADGEVGTTLVVSKSNNPTSIFASLSSNTLMLTIIGTVIAGVVLYFVLGGKK